MIAAGAGYQSITDHLVVCEEKYRPIAKAFIPYYFGHYDW
jgi:hypothetical protein